MLRKKNREHPGMESHVSLPGDTHAEYLVKSSKRRKAGNRNKK